MGSENAASTANPTHIPMGFRRFEDAPPAEVLNWVMRRFSQHQTIFTTGFGMEGCVMIDLLARQNRSVIVHYLDTHFLFRETHELRIQLESRYPNIRFSN